MKKLIVANWKMNIPDLKLWRSFRAPRNVDVVICPPSPYLDGVSKLLRAQSLGLRASLGAQDIFWEEGGAFTGEVSGKMLKGFGVTHVIIGHSERRKWLNETDEMINKKVLAALKVRLKAILCVGEPLIVRKKGIAAAKSFVKSQLTKDLAGISNLKSQISNLVIAYEPIWAIGTGKADRPEESAEMAGFIKTFLASRFQILDSRILYGGSVASANIRSFIQYKEIDGALVGGASLNVKEFKKTIEAVVSVTLAEARVHASK